MRPPTQNEIVLKEGQFWRRTIEEVPLGRQEAVLAHCASQVSIYLRNIFFVPGKEHMKISMLVGQKQLVLITELKTLPFKTYFEINDEQPDHLVPVFANHRGALLLSEPVIVDQFFPGSKIYFMLNFIRNNRIIEPANCHLFLSRDKELLYFFYPNLFSDGKMCMGPEWDRTKITSEGPVHDFAYAINKFYETEMNDHLTGVQTQRLFRKDLNGAWIYPTEEVIKENTTLAGVTFLGGFEP